VLKETLKKYETKYKADKEAAKKLISVGESPVNDKLDASELAAIHDGRQPVAANLDETLNKN
jgi:hypothetical protein